MPECGTGAAQLRGGPEICRRRRLVVLLSQARLPAQKPALLTDLWVTCAVPGSGRYRVAADEERNE